jgi:hypothetical protein
MTGATAFNPHKEEDEGYLAAKSGLSLSENPYPKGTIRYRHWRSGWQIRYDETKRAENEGYQGAGRGLRADENPHPPGTIRYDEWQRGWQAGSNEAQRALRLGGVSSGSLNRGATP